MHKIYTIIIILNLLYIKLIHSTIIDNCIQYFINTKTNISTNSSTYNNIYNINSSNSNSNIIVNQNKDKKICIVCRDGYYVKQGNCLECNKIIRNMECFKFKNNAAYANNLNNITITTTIINNNTNNNSNSNNTNDFNINNKSNN